MVYILCITLGCNSSQGRVSVIEVEQQICQDTGSKQLGNVAPSFRIGSKVHSLGKNSTNRQIFQYSRQMKLHGVLTAHHP